VIVEALARLKQEGQLGKLPPVILSGLTKDPRAPGHFDRVMERARQAGIDGHFRHLGLIPYDHVLALNANCLAMINPSHFEGWSTPIEEAKAFATPLILSDIPISREQAPDARFFAADSPTEAARALQEAAAGNALARPPAGLLMAAQNKRLDEHAASLLRTVRAAAGRS
jgi:glycosyltransferase involved in cell wall biosynthesis